ncbi:Protein of unknown function PDDEXK-like [Dillenia turbinata]|uniref:Uncharacterized protein n=1 Tax=Dillenia turbinata TaxID=194707 RepID=A0AAN8V7L4_9MAGN
MGSLEEERLVQMVHEFIESESSTPASFSNSKNLSFNQRTKYFALQEILGSGTDVESEVLENVKRQMRKQNELEETTSSSVKNWLVMSLKCDGFKASLCQTSWITSLDCPGGDYEYIDITIKDENGNSTRLIVDIDFKSQFELARPTATYTELSDTLPPIFVGDENKLRRIISLLCSAAKQSLKETGLHIPPWRRTAYMHSKWFSQCTEVPTRRGNKETKSGTSGSSKVTKWTLPIVKPKRRDFGGGS